MQEGRTCILFVSCRALINAGPSKQNSEQVMGTPIAYLTENSIYRKDV
jgi:hypothetical protein